MLPSDEMPMTTVTKITGAVTVLISCRNASASHFASVAGPGATSPNTIPAAIATKTQNHNCVRTAGSPLWGCPPGGRSDRFSGRSRLGGPPTFLSELAANLRRRAAPVALVVVVVIENVVYAQPRRAPADPPADRGDG